MHEADAGSDVERVQGLGGPQALLGRLEEILGLGAHVEVVVLRQEGHRADDGLGVLVLPVVEVRAARGPAAAVSHARAPHVPPG